MLHSIYDQPDAKAVHAQFDRVTDTLAEKLPTIAEHLEEARPDILAFTVKRSRKRARCRSQAGSNPLASKASCSRT